MEVRDYLNEINTEKTQYFVDCLKNSNWMLTATEDTIDKLMNIAVELQEYSFQNNKVLVKTYPEINFKNSVQLLMKDLIRSQKLNEYLTLYSIKKYIMIYSKNELCEMLEDMLAETRLREYLYDLIEEVPDVDLDWYSLNNIVDEMCDKEPSSEKIFNALKTQASILLNGIRYGSLVKGENLIDKVISCLESQTDLRLWFRIFRAENLEVILDLCAKYNNFLQAVFRFFDKFADEVESNYDEDLNVKYCHLNLDFEDFLKIIQSFFNDKNVYKAVNDYLKKRIQMDNKNFCFWIDVKACL